MLRLIVKIGNSFKTYDFMCEKLQEDWKGGDIIGLEVLWTGRPRLISIDLPGARKIEMIKVIREHTGKGLKEAKEFVESAPIDLPQIDSPSLTKLVASLREAGALVEA